MYSLGSVSGGWVALLIGIGTKAPSTLWFYHPLGFPASEKGKREWRKLAVAHNTYFPITGKTKIILVFQRGNLIQEIGHKSVRRARGTKHRLRRDFKLEEATNTPRLKGAKPENDAIQSRCIARSPGAPAAATISTSTGAQQEARSSHSCCCRCGCRSENS